jgi:hypothetical protein
VAKITRFTPLSNGTWSFIAESLFLASRATLPFIVSPTTDDIFEENT